MQSGNGRIRTQQIRMHFVTIVQYPLLHSNSQDVSDHKPSWEKSQDAWMPAKNTLLFNTSSTWCDRASKFIQNMSLGPTSQGGNREMSVGVSHSYLELRCKARRRCTYRMQLRAMQFNFYKKRKCISKCVFLRWHAPIRRCGTANIGHHVQMLCSNYTSKHPHNYGQTFLCYFLQHTHSFEKQLHVRNSS